MCNTPLLPIPTVPGHVTNPVAAYQQLLQSSPTRTANPGTQWTCVDCHGPHVGQSPQHALCLDTRLYSLHSLHITGVVQWLPTEPGMTSWT